MNPVTHHHVRRIALEVLEPRQLRSVAAPSPQDGNDYHLTIAINNTVVTTASTAKSARVGVSGSRWFDGSKNGGLADFDPASFVKVDVLGFFNIPHLGDYNVTRFSEPDEASVRYYARQEVAMGATIAVIDNEVWRFDIRTTPLAEVDHTIERMQKICAWIHDEEPGLKLGLYGYLSMGDVYNSTKWLDATQHASQGNVWYDASLPDLADSYADWQAASEYLRPLSESFDYVFPSLYTTTTSGDEWEHSARAIIEDSRRFGKPVIPFIWPCYHTSMGGGLGNTEIPVSLWTRELDVIGQYADAGLIWTATDVTTREDWAVPLLARASGNGDGASGASMARSTSTLSLTDETFGSSRERRARFSESVIDGVISNA